MFVKHMRLGRDPELRKTTQGNKVVNISAAYDTYVNKNKTVTTWVNISLFDRDAEFIMNHGKKGYMFKFTGEVYMDEFERNGGGTGMSLNMINATVGFSEFGGSNKSNNNNNNNTNTNKNASKTEEPVMDDSEEGDSIFDEFFEEEGA